MIWRHARGSLDLTNRAVIMGILNVTPDSFSDGGRFTEPEAAVARSLEMLANGADIIDVGGESTRPGAEPVGAKEEMERVLPVIELLLDRAPQAVVSVDTSKPLVADAALDRGAAIINDVTALRGDPAMADVVRDRGAGVILMHMRGNPRTMQRKPHYKDVVPEVGEFFKERMAFTLDAGLQREQVAFDPGIGFGKDYEHNLALCRHLDVLGVAVPGRPICLGVSRKAFLARALGRDPAALPPESRDGATVALTVFAREKGVRVLRVHRIQPNVEALRMAETVLGPAVFPHPAGTEQRT